jgi:phosphoribosylformylglycinamidine synthase
MMHADEDRPTALVITAAGINCDLELAHAFDLAGARVESIHLNDLLRDPETVERFDLIGLPGGFSFGDAVSAGRIAAVMLRQGLWGTLTGAVRRGVAMIAACNGFQVAVQMGLLPGPRVGEDWPAQPPRPIVALASNASARFVDRWCGIEIPAHTRCIWTRDLRLSADEAVLPIAHGEGRFIAGDTAILDALDHAGQIALRYRADDNPNGSMDDIAGICDASGLLLGLMPHPERFTNWQRHPWWTRLDRGLMSSQEPLGLRMFRNAVAHVRRMRQAGHEATVAFPAGRSAVSVSSASSPTSSAAAR